MLRDKRELRRAELGLALALLMQEADKPDDSIAARLGFDDLSVPALREAILGFTEITPVYTAAENEGYQFLVVQDPHVFQATLEADLFTGEFEYREQPLPGVKPKDVLDPDFQDGAQYGARAFRLNLYVVENEAESLTVSDLVHYTLDQLVQGHL